MSPIILPQNHPNPAELKQLTDSLLSFIDASSIYISVPERTKEARTIISLLVKKGSVQTSEEGYRITEKLFQSYPQFAYSIFEANWAAYSFRKGNPFFMRHCSLQELAYSTEENSQIFNPAPEELKLLLKKARTRYTKYSNETNTISRDLSMYIRNGNRLQAAYILHQTIRRLYYTASWFLTGESIPSRSIAEQQRYISPFSVLLGCLFDPEDNKDVELLEQLDSACEAVRNNKPITINPATIPAAVNKAEWLQEEVKMLFEESIRSCENKFTSANTNDTKPFQPTKKNPNPTNLPQSEETKILEDLHNIATRHFNKLKPDPNTEGTYTSQIKFTGYTDLMCVATDLIKLCINAHIDNEENEENEENEKNKYRKGEGTRLIINPKVNIPNILEIVIQLLPLHEAEYLDILAEIFSNHQKNE